MQVTKGRSKYIIGGLGLYRHPGHKIVDFMQKLDGVLSDISNHKVPCFIAGHISIDLKTTILSLIAFPTSYCYTDKNTRPGTSLLYSGPIVNYSSPRIILHNTTACVHVCLYDRHQRHHQSGVKYPTELSTPENLPRVYQHHTG